MDLKPEAGPDVADDLPPRPARPRSRLRYYVAGGLCAAAVIVLIVGGLGANIVYFRTVSEAVAERTGDGTSRLRIAGEVVAGSIERSAEGVRFQVTDGVETATVVHRGDPPELFADHVPVVAEGRWDRDEFASDRIMIRHSNEYRPPDVDQPAAVDGEPPVP